MGPKKSQPSTNTGSFMDTMKQRPYERDMSVETNIMHCCIFVALNIQWSVQAFTELFQLNFKQNKTKKNNEFVSRLNLSVGVCWSHRSHSVTPLCVPSVAISLSSTVYKSTGLVFPDSQRIRAASGQLAHSLCLITGGAGTGQRGINK